MIESVMLARLGDTVDEVVVLEWFVEAGSSVAAGAALLRVETDKVEVEVESPFTGVVVDCAVAEGDDVETGALLCRIDTDLG